VRYARDAGATCIGFTGDDGGELRNLVDCCVQVPSHDIGQQEDVHLILNHVLASAMRRRLMSPLD
jgi:D-sedoheptulose 7-phosphate isomerase